MNVVNEPATAPDQAPARPRHYDVIALSFPIVYSLEGDHDPNGLLYTLRAYRPLLEWAEARWDENDEYLPRMHRRRQLMEVVVDGIPRWQEMRRRLAEGPVCDRYLLWELGDEDEVLDRERRDAERPRTSPRERTVRQNYRTTLDPLVAALRELTGGRVRRLTEDSAVLDEWHRQWAAQLVDAERGIEEQLQKIDAMLPELLAGYPAAPPSGTHDPDPAHRHERIHRGDVRRLLLNDHVPGDLGNDPAHPYDRFNPLRPFALVRPLVLRACHGETVEVDFENRIRDREVGLHVQGDGLGGSVQEHDGTGVRFGDGAQVGDNPATTVRHSEKMLYRWRCTREGVWPINDMGDVRGTDRGTNNHGLFGALVVEPAGAQWYDPESGCRVDGTDHADGLYVDVRPVSEQGVDPDELRERHGTQAFVDFHSPGGDCSFREFAIFFHDETETHSGIPHPLPHSAMPLSYRAEPMHNRLPYRLHRRHRRGAAGIPDAARIDHAAVRIELDDTLGEVFHVAKDEDGNFLEQVSGEEQHHSSWLFGDPVTPVLRAYRGDPCRVRLVHSGVKETHVFHLHVHQWRAVAQDKAMPSEWRPGEPRGSQLLDSVSIGPQTGMTIDPLYGSGSRQHSVGDIIWHCHLYPHFHHGMWGMWRSYDRLVDGSRAYPDGTPCAPLQPLPGRDPAPSLEEQPGFPWFMDYSYPRKSPPPPSPRSEEAVREVILDGRRRKLKMPNCSDKENAAFAPGCRDGRQPGALFVDLDGLAQEWNDAAGVPERRIIRYEIEMLSRRMTYNSAGWYDPMGHHYRLLGIEVTRLGDDGTADGDPIPFDPPDVPDEGLVEPFFPRANHGDIVELQLHNMVRNFPADHFDLPAHPVECGLHVHLVKFDVLASDGSATGWNYLSGASSPGAVGENVEGEPPKNVSLHRWVVDEEFGPCFFHDHLLANFRQKRGLFAALIAEPNGTRWCLPDQTTPAWTGSQAVVVPRDDGRPCGLDEAYREAGLALGDFVPLNRADGEPLNEPDLLGGDDDPGVMGVNYRCTPLEYRGKDPSEWFSSSRSSLDVDALRRRVFEDDDARRRALEEETRGWPLDVDMTYPRIPVPRKGRGDPDTPVIYTYPGERLRIRLYQGSHEEQHSFMLNGMRWRKDWQNPGSPLVNQQTLGISEAFTVDVDPRRDSPYGIGDHLWQFTVMDDLWLGCWGLIRSLPSSARNHELLPPLPGVPVDELSGDGLTPRNRHVPDRPHGEVEHDDHGLVLEPGGNPKVTWPTGTVRKYIVVAQRHEHPYAGSALTDPWGLIYRRAEDVEAELGDGAGEGDDRGGTGEGVRETGNLRAVGVEDTDQPLVLRAHPGEWVRILLVNELLLPEDEGEGSRNMAYADPELPEFGPEVSPPRLPVEHRDHLGYPDRRTVSPRVSLHPSLLRYDVVSDDGSYVGRNHDTTVAALDVDEDAHVVHGEHGAAAAVVHRTDHGIGHRDPNWREYWWYVDEQLAPVPAAKGGRGQVCYLFDMADIRNHRHHGLVGALVVEPADVTPVDPAVPNTTKWSGPHVHLRDGDGKVIAQEHALFLQDGLRHFLHGDIDQPLPDISPSDPPVDVGQKAISYRSPLTPNRRPMALPNDTAPFIRAQADLPIWLRLVCAGDKPRNHTFTLHGFAWNAAPWVKNGPQMGSVGAICAGFAQDLSLELPEGRPWDPGDHAYRSGAFRWAVTQGMWGILRIKDRDGR